MTELGQLEKESMRYEEMNIIEAIKSGKRFRPKDNDGEWYFVDRGSIKAQIDGLDAINVFMHTSLLDSEWEVEEEKKELSWNEIEKAFDPYSDSKDGLLRFSFDLAPVKQRLGFKE